MREDLWSEEKTNILIEMWAEGKSGTVIGKSIGCTRNAVIGKAHRLKLPARTRAHNHKSRTIKAKVRRARKIRLQPKIKPAKPLPPHVLDNAIPLEQRLTIYTLEWDRCHFPVNDPGTPEFFYCGAAVLDNEGRRYCEDHKKRMYVAPSTRSAERRRGANSTVSRFALR